MAKNLKLNIKNAQLAEALKLTQVKKPAAKKSKKALEEEKSAPATPIEPAITPPAEVVAPVQESAPPPAPPKVEIPVKAEAPKTTPVAAAPVKREEIRVTPPAARPYSGQERPSYPSQQRPYTQGYRSESSTDRGPRPPYQGTRPPYQGTRPPYQGNRPPYPSSRPPSQGFRPSSHGQTGVPYKREPLIDQKKIPIPPKEGAKEIIIPKKTMPGFRSDDKDIKAQKKPAEYRSFDSRDRQGLRASDDEIWRRKKAHKHKPLIQEEVIRPKSLKVRLPITVKDLAVEMKLKASQLIAKLFMQGVIITLNDQLIDETTVQLLGHEFECEITIDTSEEQRIRITGKSVKEEIAESTDTTLILRPPVITFMGHVDHGKTSLIDAIRKSNRVAGEAGAITQHIGAFTCHTAVGNITVLDTPGHEAFSAMRSRGANVTDIVVLVVAGDEGIRAQTLEAIDQAQEAKVPIVVAINKCDKPNFNTETVYRQLADKNLLPESWGGTTITVNCSAVTGEGVSTLLEMLALQAEILELRANPSQRARGAVIESELHKGLGSVATLLVQNGTLHIGDAIVFDQHYARVKTMHDEYGKEMAHAGPSTPVKITGLSDLPDAGSEFIAVKDEKEAREIAEKRSEGHKHKMLLQSKKTPVENILQQKAESQEKKTLNLIVKADVQGSLEALKTSLRKIPSKKVEINFISEGVGEISESDIQFAITSKASIIGFHTQIESHADSLIKQHKVKVRMHDVIYHAVDDVKEIMLGLLDKIPQENDIGEATVKAVFKSSQLGNIAGCMVSSGIIRRNAHIRLVRDNETIWKGPISSLKRIKEDVREVSKGYECGIVLQNFADVKEGDILQAYEITYLQQELT